MLARVDSLAAALDVTRCLTEEPTDFQSGVIGGAILMALQVRTEATWVVNRF